MNKPNHKLQALVGYVQDVYRIATCRFTNPHSYFKFLILNRIRQQTGARVLIETGTYLGVTSARCAAVFDYVYTIELDSQLAKQATRNLSRKRNVRVLQGDASELLPQLLQDQKINNVLVFLDGHFSGGATAKGDVPEPAVLEIETLGLQRDKVRAIVIDDFRSFGTEPGFPTKSALLASAEKHFGDHKFSISVHLDQCIIARCD